MPVIERPKELSEWQINCDECGHYYGTHPAYQAASVAAYEAGWICFGKIWICAGCRWKGQQAVELRPVPAPVLS